MKKIVSLFLIILMFNIAFCFADADNEIPRGSVTLRWEYVQASVGGYAIYLWDGYAYREVDRVHQDVLEWYSDEARIYPKEETIKSFEADSVTQSLFTAKGKGERLRNNPNGLYRVMKNGTEHSEEEYENQYLFKIGTINEFGEVVLSAPIVARLDNWAEMANTPPEVSLIINNGATKTTDAEVNLTITAKDDTSKESELMMRFANDTKDKFGEWEAFDTDKVWELSDGYGEKTVFVEVKDKEGDSTVASDKITLEKMEKIDFDLETENGAYATKLDNVTLEIKGIDDLENYTCSYVIDNTEKSVEISEDNKIILPLEKENKNKFIIRLAAKTGNAIGEQEIEIWKLS